MMLEAKEDFSFAFYIETDALIAFSSYFQDVLYPINTLVNSELIQQKQEVEIL